MDETTAGYNEFMSDEGKSSQPASSSHEPVVGHVSGAHQLLTSLKEKIGEHPELAEAITELEMALSILTVKTGGLL
jgi:hypothetical protein